MRTIETLEHLGRQKQELLGQKNQSLISNNRVVRVQVVQQSMFLPWKPFSLP